MREALIGYTGLVGGNLKKQHNFTDFFNSKNFNDMKGQHYSLTVCAGVSAAKWIANKEPEKIRYISKNLRTHLKQLKPIALF